MIKNLNLSFFILVVLTVFLNFCVSRPVNNFPGSPSVVDPSEPTDPDPGEPEPNPTIQERGWKEISTISGNSGIYATLSWSSKYIARTCPNQICANYDVFVNSNKTGYNRFSTTLVKTNFRYDIIFNVNKAMASNIKADTSTIFSPYLIDNNGKILESPLGTISFSELTTSGNAVEIAISNEKNKLNMNKPEYEKKDIDIILVYEGTDKKTYYIKYPLVFTYR